MHLAHFSPVVTLCRTVVKYPGQVLTLKQLVLYRCIGSVRFYIIIWVPVSASTVRLGNIFNITGVPRRPFMTAFTSALSPATTDLPSVSQILRFEKRPMSGILHRGTFQDWLLSLSILPRRFVQVAVCFCCVLRESVWLCLPVETRSEMRVCGSGLQVSRCGLDPEAE